MDDEDGHADASELVTRVESRRRPVRDRPYHAVKARTGHWHRVYGAEQRGTRCWDASRQFERHRRAQRAPSDDDTRRRYLQLLGEITIRSNRIVVESLFRGYAGIPAETSVIKRHDTVSERSQYP